MKVYIATTLALIATACSTTAVDESNLPIQIISSAKSEACEYISSVAGTETNFFNSAADKIPVARALAAQEAANLGGDSGVVTDTDIESNGHLVTVMMDVYRCKK